MHSLWKLHLEASLRRKHFLQILYLTLQFLLGVFCWGFLDVFVVSTLFEKLTESDPLIIIWRQYFLSYEHFNLIISKRWGHLYKSFDMFLKLPQSSYYPHFQVECIWKFSTGNVCSFDLFTSESVKTLVRAHFWKEIWFKLNKSLSGDWRDPPSSVLLESVEMCKWWKLMAGFEVPSLGRWLWGLGGGCTGFRGGTFWIAIAMIVSEKLLLRYWRTTACDKYAGV